MHNNPSLSLLAIVARWPLANELDAGTGLPMAGRLVSEAAGLASWVERGREEKGAK